MSVSSAASLTPATATSSAPKATAAVPAQGGVIDGLNPTHYNPKDPIPLFIIQVRLLAGAARGPC